MHVPLRLLMKPLQGRCCHWGPLVRRAAVGRRQPRLRREALPRAGRPVIVARWPGSPRFRGGLRLRRLLAPGRRPCALGRTTQRRCASMAPRAGSRTELGCGSCAQVRVGLGGLWAGGAGGGSNRRPGRDPMASGGILARVAALPLRVSRGGPGHGVGPGRSRRRAMPESPVIRWGRGRFCDAALQQTGTPAGGAIGIRSGPVCSSACMTRKGTKRIAVWLKPKRVGHSSTGQARRTGEADRARAKGSDCDFARVPARWGRVGSEGFRDSRRRLPAVTHASAPRRRAHTRNFPAWVGEGSRRPWGSDPRTSRHFRNLRWRIGFPGSGVGWGCWTSWDENHPARLSTINIPFRRGLGVL